MLLSAPFRNISQYGRHHWRWKVFVQRLRPVSRERSLLCHIRERLLLCDIRERSLSCHIWYELDLGLQSLNLTLPRLVASWYKLDVLTWESTDSYKYFQINIRIMNKRLYIKFVIYMYYKQQICWFNCKTYFVGFKNPIYCYF